MATLNLPAWRYGLRYKYGLFKQRITKQGQEEIAEDWLEVGSVSLRLEVVPKCCVDFLGIYTDASILIGNFCRSLVLGKLLGMI
ncbi:hypothetical protein CRYUN_Cryun25bG0096900 [Craigia yunnanensis]